MERYFFVIEFLPHQADLELLAGRCMSIMHGFSHANSQLKGKFGTLFPMWTNDSIGKAIGFISSDQQALIGLSFQPYFTDMQAKNTFRISPVSQVSEDVSEVKIMRNYQIAKSFLYSKMSRVKRLKKRAEARGEVYKPVNHENREFEHFHKIETYSNSTQMRMTMYLQKEAVSHRVDGLYNGYGFATNDKYQTTVPDITLF